MFALQTLLRGVVPDSFPCRLSDKPMPAKNQRRFIIIDDNVHRIHGHRIETVSTKIIQTLLLTFVIGEGSRIMFALYLDCKDEV